MAWRSIMIQNPAKLSLRRGQLKLDNDEGEFTLPLEDITALILESPQISLNSSLLSKCQEHGIVVITCDDTHTPNGVLLPFLQHSRQSKIARIQLSWTDSVRNKLWKRIIQEKIKRQADCLCLCQGKAGKQKAQHLYAMSKLVESGDIKNLEARAAKYYWQELMGKEFYRSGNCIVNSALDYGYAIIRAYIARSQVAYGLIPSFGIHHNNDLNAFNLTDDIIEIFRPFVDRNVFQMAKNEELKESEQSLSLENRQKLVSIGNMNCRIEGQIHTIANACDKISAGLVNAIECKTPQVLPVPVFIKTDN